jgi:two-component system chemotaxis response regulator CheY
MRILIVEDDLLSRKFLEGVLGGFGELSHAENGLLALEAVRAAHGAGKPFDLICLDIMMPEMDGQQALEEIRRLERELAVHPKQEVKVIMTTALNDPKSVVRAYYKGGATAYLHKPIDKDAMVDTMRRLGLIP